MDVMVALGLVFALIFLFLLGLVVTVGLVVMLIASIIKLIAWGKNRWNNR